MQTIAQNFAVVNYLGALNQSSVSSLSKSSTGNFLSLKGYQKVTFIINTGAMTEATTQVSAYQAKTVAGGSVSTTALNLDQYWTNTGSTGATPLVRTTASSDQVVVDATNSALYVLEYDAKQLNATSQFDCIALGITGISAAANIAITAILHDARYAADGMPINAYAN